MLVAIDFRNTLIVDVSKQPDLLQLLTAAKSYKRDGWGSDCTFKLSDDVPEVIFIKEDQILGETDQIKKLEDALQQEKSTLYNARKELQTVQKDMLALTQKFAELESKYIESQLPPVPMLEG